MGCVRRLQGQTAGAVETGVAAEFRGLEFHLLDADGLGPFLRLGIDVTQELRRQAKHAAAEYDLVRVEQADEVRHGHAPELNSLSQNFLGNRVAAVVSRENIPRSQPLVTL